MSSSSSSSLMSSHGMALATAVAVSGTVILIALRHQKPHSLSFAAFDPNPTLTPPWYQPRPCISSSGERKKERANKKQPQQKKRVQFTAEAVEHFDSSSSSNEEVVPGISAEEPLGEGRGEREEEEARGMPANRVALYNGILRDRVMQRMACRY